MPRKLRFPQASEVRRHFTPATPWAERDRAEKTDRVNVRISPDEKVEMAETAEKFGLGVSEYLLRLHRLTVAIQSSRSRR
jgi:hypothetical protein